MDIGTAILGGVALYIFGPIVLVLGLGLVALIGYGLYKAYRRIRKGV